MAYNSLSLRFIPVLELRSVRYRKGILTFDNLLRTNVKGSWSGVGIY